MKLFKVSTRKYKDYYVIATDYNDAISKAKEYREAMALDVKIDNDGSLQIPMNEIEDDELCRVELLTEEIIK